MLIFQCPWLGVPGKLFKEVQRWHRLAVACSRIPGEIMGMPEQLPSWTSLPQIRCWGNFPVKLEVQGLGWHWSRVGCGCAFPTLPAPSTHPGCPQGFFPGCASALHLPSFPQPYTHPKCLGIRSWEISPCSALQRADNDMLTCSFVQWGCRWPFFDKQYSVVCFLLLLKCVAPCPALCALSNLPPKWN